MTDYEIFKSAEILNINKHALNIMEDDAKSILKNIETMKEKWIYDKTDFRNILASYIQYNVIETLMEFKGFDWWWMDISDVDRDNIRINLLNTVSKTLEEEGI